MQSEENKNCQEKMAFNTAKEAQDTARVAGYQHGADLKYYRCRACGLWHLSSKYPDKD